LLNNRQNKKKLNVLKKKRIKLNVKNFRKKEMPLQMLNKPFWPNNKKRMKNKLRKIK